MLNLCGCTSRRTDDRKEDRRDAASSTAMDILKERLARGEINKEEFEEKRRIIREA